MSGARWWLGVNVCLSSIMMTLYIHSGIAAPLLELDASVDPVWVAGTVQCISVSTWESSDAWTRTPVAAALEVELSRSGQSALPLSGVALGGEPGQTVCIGLPRLKAGPASLVLRANADLLYAEVALGITIAERERLVARVDRPVARPGEKVHWRATLGHAVDGRPVVGAEILVRLEDPRHNVVWQGKEETDAGGAVAGSVPLAEEPITGTWTLIAAASEVQAEVEFQVKPVRLPAFFVVVDAERAEGGQIRARVRATRPDGWPVAGSAVITLMSPDGASLAMSRSAALDGRGEATLTLGSSGATGPLVVRAAVEDAAQRTERGSTAIGAIDASAPRLRLIPERERVACGIPQRLTAIVASGDGTLWPATIRLSAPSLGWSEERSSGGAASFTVHVPCEVLDGKAKKPSNSMGFEVKATIHGVEPPREHILVDTFHWAMDPSPEAAGPAIHVDRNVLEPGEPVRVEIRWPTNAPIEVSLWRQGAAVARGFATPHGAELHRAELAIPPGVHGALAARASVVKLSKEGTGIALAHVIAPLFVRPARLDVAVAPTPPTRPGASVDVKVRVSGEDGQGMENAVLAASVIDGRALALGTGNAPWIGDAMRTDVLTSADAVAWALAVGRGEEGEEERTALGAAVDQLRLTVPAPVARVHAAELMRALASSAQAAFSESARFVARRGGAAVSTGSPPQALEPLAETLAAAGWSASRLTDAWGTPLSWEVALRAAPGLSLAGWGVSITQERIGPVADALWEHRKAWRRRVRLGGTATLHALGDLSPVAVGQAIDAWGRPFYVHRERAELRVSSHGPDGVADTADDIVEWRSRGGRGLGLYGVGMGAGGHASHTVSCRGASVEVRNAEAPVAIRKRFDETVLWQTGLLTAADGWADLEFSLGDQVTTWSVDVEAISGHGAVGRGHADLIAALDWYLEDRAPVALAEGDSLSVPVVVTSGVAEARALRVAAEATGAIRLGQGTEHAVDVPPKGVVPVSIPVVAAGVGDGILRLSLVDAETGAAVDALERTIRVEPRGMRRTAVVSAPAQAGAAVLAMTVPADAVPGSVDRRVRVLRGAADWALDGVEDLIREPHGCFEQTSSAVYPNLLVARLLKHHDNARDHVERATELCAKGYQRLLSFEVPGGGFSWFGDAPANRVLTAYGLLEFAELSHVWPVDGAVMRRTTSWLVEQQQRDGRWEPDPSWLHDWSAVQGQASATAYITWALAHSGTAPDAVARGLAFLRKHEAELEKQPYLVALWASAEARANTNVRKAASRLDAWVRGRSTEASPALQTMMYGGGETALNEVLALAAEAHVLDAQPMEAAQLLDALAGQRAPRWGWGSTQATVLALRAFAAAAADQRPVGPVSLHVEVGGHHVSAIHLDEGPGIPSVVLPAPSGDAPSPVVLRGPESSAWAAELEVAWREPLRTAPSQQGLGVDLVIPPGVVAVGDSVKLLVRAHNPGATAVAMPMVSVPVPPGFRAVEDTLTALVRERRAAKTEDAGDTVHVYLSALGAGATWEAEIVLESEAECDVLVRPAVAWAYYTPEVRGESAPGRLRARRTAP